MAEPKARFRLPGASEQLVVEHCQLRALSEPAELGRSPDLWGQKKRGTDLWSMPLGLQISKIQRFRARKITNARSAIAPIRP